MPGEEDDYRASKDPLYKASVGTFASLDKPAALLRSFVTAFRKEPEKYYHRRFKRVPTIDQCGINDPVCRFEANEQFKRDKAVDDQIIKILRKRKVECAHYWGESRNYKCTKELQDYEDASENWYIKYGDVSVHEDVLENYMKQKHRLIWERRKRERDSREAVMPVD